MAEIELIAKWQQSISSERITEEQPLIAQLYTACSELLQKLLTTLRSQLSVERSTVVSLERSHGYLVLWADGYGVKDGQLDSCLDRSRRAKQSTFRLLMSICQTLTKRLLPLVAKDERPVFAAESAEVTQAIDKLKCLIQQNDSYDSDSETSSETSSTCDVSELEEIAEDLNTDTQCLLDLGSRFMEQTVGPVTDEKTLDPSEVITWDPSSNFIDRIRWRYPSCDEALVARLGKANWARIQRYQEIRDQNSRPKGAEHPSDVSITTEPYHDSGIGTSISSHPPAAPASQYAETIVSYRGGRGGSIRIPTLPDGAKAGIPFTCVACGKIVKITNKSALKKHLFLDLQPYMCLADNCDFNGFPFATKTQWEDHLALDHEQSGSWESIKCPICKEMTQSGKVYVTTHLARHMEEIALTVLPTNPDSEDGTDVESRFTSSEASLRDKLNSFKESDEDRYDDKKPNQIMEDQLSACKTALLHAYSNDVTNKPGGYTGNVSTEKEVASHITELINADSPETTTIEQPMRKPEETTSSLHECMHPGCNRHFKRPSDLHRHETTHNRPWKCPVPTCKYHEYGWPTEKELNRHVNDKHASEPAMYECHFQPCPYKSKRESNCKQHMEKAHGWTYVRTKTNDSLVRPAVRPALRPAASRRPSSNAGIPTFSKSVHFDLHLEDVRHFSQVDRPAHVGILDTCVDDEFLKESGFTHIDMLSKEITDTNPSISKNRPGAALPTSDPTRISEDTSDLASNKAQQEFVLFDTPRSPIHAAGPSVPSEDKAAQNRIIRMNGPKPQCWEHGCNGREYATFSNLLRHQREKSGQASKATRPGMG